MLLTLLSFFAMLIVLILAHELGHFFTAKLFRVKVEEFGIFLPPRLFGFRIGETLYSLNAIPLGGFNKLAGEEDPNVPGSLSAKRKSIRLLVLGAGSLMNLLLPLLLIGIALMVPHLETTNTVIVQEVAANSPAFQAGIQAGDMIISINGTPIAGIEDYSAIIQSNLGKEITIVIKHAETISEVTLTPRKNPPAGEGASGVALTLGTITKSYAFWRAVPDSFVRYWDFLVLYKDGIVATVRGVVPFQVSGPVGIAQATGEIARQGVSSLLLFAAFISINLGVVNLFPIPGLDGGRIVFVLLEWIRHGKRVSPKTEQMIHTIGFLLLLALLIFVSYHDIVRIIQGKSLLP